MGKDKFVPDQEAVLEGAGKTEFDDLRGLQVTEVNIIQNEECYDKIKSANKRFLTPYKDALYLGINAGIICTVGIVNSEGIVQVLSKV